MQEAPPWGQSYCGPITAAGFDRKMKLTGCVDAAKNALTNFWGSECYGVFEDGGR